MQSGNPGFLMSSLRSFHYITVSLNHIGMTSSENSYTFYTPNTKPSQHFQCLSKPNQKNKPKNTLKPISGLHRGRGHYEFCEQQISAISHCEGGLPFIRKYLTIQLKKKNLAHIWDFPVHFSAISYKSTIISK